MNHHGTPRPVSKRRTTRLAIAAAAAAAALGLPAASFGATPNVVRIDAKTGKQTVLAGGAPWRSLEGIAVTSSGTVYVSNLSEDSTAGIYSLAAPSFGIQPFDTSDPDGSTTGLVASGTTLYALNEAGIKSHDTTMPGLPRLVSSGDILDRINTSLRFATLSGNALYATAFYSCDSIEGNGGMVVKVDTTTGAQSMVKTKLGCDEPQGIAAEPDGTLAIATRYGGEDPRIVTLNPATGKQKVLSAGGALKDPRGIAVTASGDLVVADAESGVLGISAKTGAQTKIATGDDLWGANGIALDTNGNMYVTAAGKPPVLKATAASRQRLSKPGVKLRVSCKPRCNVAYDVAVKVTRDYPFSTSGSVDAVSRTRTLTVKLPAEINQRIRSALRDKRAARLTVTLTPIELGTGALGRPVPVTVRFTR